MLCKLYDLRNNLRADPPCEEFEGEPFAFIKVIATHGCAIATLKVLVLMRQGLVRANKNFRGHVVQGTGPGWEIKVIGFDLLRNNIVLKVWSYIYILIDWVGISVCTVRCNK